MSRLELIWEGVKKEQRGEAGFPLQYQSVWSETGHRCLERANREIRGSRRWSRWEGRLLAGAALQSLVSHANTHDRYSCNKSCEMTDDSIDICYNITSRYVYTALHPRRTYAMDTHTAKEEYPVTYSASSIPK